MRTDFKDHQSLIKTNEEKDQQRLEELQRIYSKAAHIKDGALLKNIRAFS